MNWLLNLLNINKKKPMEETKEPERPRRRTRKNLPIMFRNKGGSHYAGKRKRRFYHGHIKF